MGSTVYLIHFDRPYKHAQHYLGSTSNLKRRLQEHREGHGGRLMAVITQAGITWRLARTWEGGHVLERRFKRWHGGKKLCPICWQELEQGEQRAFEAAAIAERETELYLERGY